MKVVPFTIPVAANTSLHVQHEALPHFYEHLHRHREMQITWIRRGTGTLLAGNAIHHFSEGDVFVIGPNVPHVFKSDPQYFRKSKKLLTESLTLFFDPGWQWSHVLKLPELDGVAKWLKIWPNGCRIPAPQSVSYQALMEAVTKAEKGTRVAAFIRLLQQLASGKKNQPLTGDVRIISEAEGHRMNTLMQYTMKHFMGAITIEEAAKQIHMTPPAFCRYFKKHTRKTYISFLNELRIQEACKLLQQNANENISAIAWKTGFNNVPNFNRVFKKVMKESPGAYWKRISAVG